MAKGISAKRARRQSLKRHEINRHRVRTIRTLIRSAREAIASGSDETAERVQRAVVALDRVAGKAPLHRNNAARRKGRLIRLLNRSKADA